MSAIAPLERLVAGSCHFAILVFGTAWLAGSLVGAARGAEDAETPDSLHTYYTGGVHNDKDCLPPEKCIYPREPGQPSDPSYPAWWSSAWTMYRVFNKSDTVPPPYSSPPQGLTVDDYQVSYGATYYDSTYIPYDHDGVGAMMEHYDKYCLPIFPFANNYTCSFVSLGNKAYFLTYADRPKDMPACCQFSLHNHAPMRDFIKHLPYNSAESAHLGGAIQAYSTRPDGILFGYAYYKEATPDSFDTTAPPYRHPQSFYFAGDPPDPPDAPIVSQNYTSFRMEKPDPRTTWDEVQRVCPAKPGWCCLFASDCPTAEPAAAASSRPTWATIKP